MEMIFLGIGFISCCLLTATIIEFHIGFKKLLDLSHQPPLEPALLPSVSIIFSALNEENDIEHALKSMLALNYPRLEIIAINDRSTDQTQNILNRLEAQFPNKLQIIHIETLPEGWLGKNHALHVGSKLAKSDWLLFTDADVLMKPDLLSKSMSYALQHHLDHLTIHEHHLRKSFGLKVFYVGHYLTYSFLLKPWRIRHSWSKKSLGHGSFNLVKTKSYLACGGHRTIAMECLDDIKLGKLLKQQGFKQDTVNGQDFIEREWYKSLSDMVLGLRKNSFAFYDYRLFHTLRDIVFAFLFFVWPVIACVACSGLLQWINAVNVCLTLYMSLYVAKQYRLERKFAFLYPISILIFLYSVFNSIIFTYLHKGVIWRGTHYPLESLKK